MALLLKHVSERPQPIVELRPDAPPALRDAIERAMMKSPEDRWPTAAALREALMSGRTQPPSWRPEQREPVRYTSPRPNSVRGAAPARDASRVEARPVSPRGGVPAPIDRSPSAMEVPRGARGAIVLEPEHLAALTAAQREDLRIWHGRITLLDRIKAMRGYTWLTIGATIGAMVLLGFGADEGIPPLFLAPIVPIYMGIKLRKRGRSLRESGLRLRRVLLSPRAKWVLPAPPPQTTEQQLEKLVTREVLESPHGTAVRRAAADRSSIMAIAAGLSKADRSLLSDLTPTVNALVERVASVAEALHRLDQSFDPRLVSELDSRIAQASRDGDSPEAARQLALLQRQRATLEELVQRRATLARQLESAGLALGNLRLDMVKLRSSGLQSAVTDVSTATQEARALSREIGILLESAAEAGKL